MAASSQTGTSSTGKRMWLFGIALIVIIAALYTGGWYYAAAALKTNVMRALGDKNAAGITGQCSDLSLQGFPFRIGLSCSKVDIDDHVNGVSGSFDDLNASAHVYAPGNISWNLNSPAEIRTAQGLSVSAEWKDLQSTLITKGNGIEEGRTVIEGLKAGIASSFTGQNFDVSADHTEIHVRQNGPNLEATVGVEKSNTVIKDFPQPLPTLSASADITLADKAGLLDGSDKGGLLGASGTLHRVVADIGDGRVMTLSGPFSIDDQGLVSGQFKLEIEQIGPWRDSLKQTIPAAKHIIDSASKILKALAAGGDKVSVDLTADHGNVFLSGFIPLGQIPPI
ncbi:DUF2125 domain-containing protein [Neorhizobium sp. P12A]|uniref:DUF2125 domain-containing protein n=1 Tax=Rhizobium/Agrobacterium group TaxID=227290 RepID=UPI001045D046|nr:MULTISPECIES: DUF2125 domain-containing protein [Rhizobium/Agrobacterium group]KAA0698955.1 DUF2125 domain-containing protein [Neorhizobium sp. P12A]TCR89847.1 hypothetical protein EV561_10467 [Rhizobium sp. BK376]